MLDPNNKIDLYVLHYVFMPRLNKSLDIFVMQWNNHPLSSEHGRTHPRSQGLTADTALPEALAKTKTGTSKIL